MKRKLLIIIIFLCCSIRVFAQFDSLQHYLNVAEKCNPQLQAQYNRYLSATEKIRQAGVLPDPQLEVGFFVRPMETLMGKQYADIKLMQMFPWFGTLGAAKDEARYMAQMESDVWAGMKREIMFNVQKEYFALYALHLEIDMTRRSIDLLKRMEQSALYRYETGTSTQAPASGGKQSAPLPAPTSATGSSSGMNMSGMPAGAGTSSSGAGMSSSSGMSGMNNMNSPSGGTMSDVLLLRIETAEAENNLLSLIDLAEIRSARFNNLLKRPTSSSVALPDSLPPIAFTLDEQDIAADIRRNNPMLQMYVSETARNEAAAKMNRRMGLPMIGAGIEYMPMGTSSMSMPDMNGKDMVMPMVSLSLPIYRGKYKAQQREIEMMQRSVEADSTNAANMLLTEMKEAMQSYNDAARRFRLYQTQQSLSQQNLNLLLMQYSTGSAGLNDILRAGQQLLDYNVKSAKALADLHTAKAWVEKLRGAD